MSADGRSPAAPLVTESRGGGEQRMSFRAGDSWCSIRSIELRAGVRLGVTRCQFEPSFSFAAVQPPSEIEFVVSKGSTLRARTKSGGELLRGGNTLQVGRTRRALDLQVLPTDGEPFECVSVSMDAARLRELLGTSVLPQVFARLTESETPFALVSQAMTPGLYRLLDEISNADATGTARRLWHEAKALELVAQMTDALVETDRANDPRLSPDEVDRVERVCRRLVERLDAPPTLAALARDAGFNETKLKGAFRARFGAPVFAYLRQVRMEEARRLLLTRRFNVTEVATRVGYANPSKFAAAFRKQFGMSPSAL
jgi:AraC-like DNA-binding protein